ncbi:MAG: hypothetical protein HYS74_00815 [Parcubacteria group bacterium]|nr:hypothetical protein [Parcubacteria group bacterium]
MLYLFTGFDSPKIKAQQRAFVDALRKKKPDAPFFSFDGDSVSVAALEERARSSSLFEPSSTVVLHDVFQNDDAASFIAENAALLAASPAVFVVCENALPRKMLAVLARNAEKVWEPREEPAAAPRDRAVFSLTDAVGRRDRRAAWVTLQTLWRDGKEPEAVHGALFWQVKTLCSVKQAQTRGARAVSALRLPPFVLRKALSCMKKYTEDELKKLSSDLVRAYHEVRQGGDTLPVALEKFVLRI